MNTYALKPHKKGSVIFPPPEAVPKFVHQSTSGLSPLWCFFFYSRKFWIQFVHCFIDETDEHIIVFAFVPVNISVTFMEQICKQIYDGSSPTQSSLQVRECWCYFWRKVGSRGCVPLSCTPLRISIRWRSPGRCVCSVTKHPPKSSNIDVQLF